MRRLAACFLLAGALIPSGAHAADPSASCNAGVIPPQTSPAGVGARITSEPMVASLTACVANGPVPGHAKVSVHAGDPSVTVVVDGDPSATLLGCTDGYNAVRAGSQGVSMYHAPDGGFTSRARAKSATEIWESAAKHCAPASA